MSKLARSCATSTFSRRIQQDATPTRRHRLHVGNAGTLQHRMRQQEVGISVPSLSATIAMTGLPGRCGFKASTKACAWRSATDASPWPDGSGTPAPQPVSASAPNTGAVNARSFNIGQKTTRNVRTTVCTTSAAVSVLTEAGCADHTSTAAVLSEAHAPREEGEIR